jgi:hypothetical protein
VVLNVSNGVSDAVSSAKVEVLEPNISMTESQNPDNDFVEITNNSNREVNIAGYKILYGSKNFIIAQDTILSANSNIKIPLQISGQEKISLTYPNGTNLVDTISEKEKENEISYIKSQIDTIENKIALLRKPEDIVINSQNVEVAQGEQIKVAEDTRSINGVKDESVQVEENTQVKNSTSTAESTKEVSQSFIESLLATPRKIFDFIKW